MSQESRSRACNGQFGLDGQAVSTDLTALRRNSHKNRYMQNVFNKHQRFEFEVLVETKVDQERHQVEQAWLDDHFGQVGCLNLSKSARGPMVGRKHTIAARARMSAAHENKDHAKGTARLLAVNASRIGKKLPEPHRRAIQNAWGKRKAAGTSGWSDERKARYAESAGWSEDRKACYMAKRS